MSRRTTKCLTWGETRRSGCSLTDESGRRVGFLDFEAYVTLCGKPAGTADPDYAPLPSDLPPLPRRPMGVCRACWRQVVTTLHASPHRK